MYPGDTISVHLTPELRNETWVSFTPRKHMLTAGWNPQIIKLNRDKSVGLTNQTDNLICLMKNEHLGDFRAVVSQQEALMENLHRIDQKIPMTKQQIRGKFVEDVVIDPDEILEQSWKDKFRTLCSDYEDIIQYNPGVYNGAYGMVEDSLDLTDIPPPITRCYTPRYSKDQRDLLADKMDELLQLGILSYPEDVGVTPAFTSPSMLVPKPGKDEG